MTWPTDQLGLLLGSGGSGWVVLVLIALVMIVPFGPTEAAAVTAGTLAGAGVVPVWVAILAVAGGMLLGDLLTYTAAGRTLEPARRRGSGRPRLATRFAELETTWWWRDAGLAGLRFIPGARTPVALLARELPMTRTRFCLVAGAGSLLWAGLWIGGGSALTDGAATLLTR